MSARTGAGAGAYVLAGDIGGTKTRLGIFSMGRRRPVQRHAASYPSREFPDLESIVARFLGGRAPPVRAACFGVAGPVFAGATRTTNLPWHIAEARLQRRFGWRSVTLINDLLATALAVPLLTSRETLALNRARARPGQTMAVIAPGTGLGQALLVPEGAGYRAVPSEGGHADLAPNNSDEAALWMHLHRRFGHVSTERVVSGPGLMNVYAWLKDTGRYREPGWLVADMARMDPARAVALAGLHRKTPLCVAALRRFASVFGAAAGNLALHAMATGGVYLGGGIPPRILPTLTDGRFMRAFADKGKFRALLERIPVRVILNDEAALLGAARRAFDGGAGR